MKTEETAEWVFSGNFPEPWELDSAWLDRLEISGTNQRRYKNLSENERLLTEANRQVLREYEKEGLLQKEKNIPGLMRHTAEAIDAHWLRKGKGRAVDFKSAFTVLEAFARYKAWATSYAQRGDEVFSDVLVPYYVDELSDCGGPGFLSVQMSGTHSETRKFGEIRWEEVNFSVNDILAKGDPEHALFERHPFNFYPFGLDNRDARKGRRGMDRRNGLVAASRRGFEKVVKENVRSVSTHCTALTQVLSVGCKRPSQGEIQSLFDYVTDMLARYGVGGKVKQLEFKVASDLSTTVSSVLAN